MLTFRALNLCSQNISGARQMHCAKISRGISEESRNNMERIKKEMKTRLNWFGITALIILGTIARVNADQTNLVQGLYCHLTGVSQGTTQTNGNIARTSLSPPTVETHDVITVLGSATGNSFSDAAKLVLITPLAGSSPTIWVRDGTVSVEVTSFFEYEVKTGVVTSSVTNLKSGRSSSSDYSIQRLALVGAPGANLAIHFDVQGIAAQNTLTGVAGARTELNVFVTGFGDEPGKLLILEGSFRLQGSSLEVVSTTPPPNA
jgi:hypothetical protein